MCETLSPVLERPPIKYVERGGVTEGETQRCLDREKKRKGVEREGEREKERE